MTGIEECRPRYTIGKKERGREGEERTRGHLETGYNNEKNEPVSKR